MKQKSFKLILSVALCLTFVNFAAASEQLNLRKSDEERNADFNQAISEIPYDVSDFDKLSFQDGLKRSKNNFSRLYHAQWKTLGMAEKLERAVNKAFDENTKDLMWGTAGIQIGINKDNIIENIQEAVAFKFAETFDDFLRELEGKWGDTLQKDVADFYRRTSVSILASDRNPMIQAYIRGSSAAQDKGFDVMERIKTSMQQQYPDLGISGGKLAGGFIAVILRQQIQKIIAKQLGKTALRKVTRTGISKAAGMVVPVAGWVMTLWGAYDIASIAWNAPDEVRKMLQESNRSLYYNEIPEIYWDAMSPYVMDTFVDEFGKLQKIKEDAVAIAGNPLVAELVQDLNGDEAVQFNERVSALSRILGRAGYDDLLKDFGELIRDSSRRDFETLASMLQQGNKLQVKEWLSIAGAKYFDLYNAFTPDIWSDFPPNQESFEALSWIMKLPPKARNIAVKLSMTDINWIKNELPERYLSHLFSSSNPKGGDPASIHDEINRLSQLPDIETRRPWQSAASYYGTLYGFYLKIFVFAIAALIIIRILLSFKGRAKKINVQPAVMTSPNPGPVVINIPPSYPSMPTAAPVQTMPNKKFKVVAKISTNLANELKTITWDMSQQILPADEDDKRILSVEIDSLDGIASWLAKYKNEVEILQPDELKLKLNF